MKEAAAWDVQKAVYTLLSGSEELQALHAAVYDSVPEFSSYPYILIGFYTEVPHDTYGRTGKEITLTTHIYSLYNGNKELYAIRAVMDDLLNRKTRTQIDLGADHDLVGCTIEYSDILEEDDFSDTNKVKHMVTRYRLWVVEKQTI